MNRYINKGGFAYKLVRKEHRMFNTPLEYERFLKEPSYVPSGEGIEITPELLKDWPEWGIKEEGEFRLNVKFGNPYDYPATFTAVPVEPKAEQKKLLTEVMKGDENDGLYEQPGQSFSEEDADFMLECVDAFWRHCLEQLERKDLGDIQRRNIEKSRDRAFSFIQKYK